MSFLHDRLAQDGINIYFDAIVPTFAGRSTMALGRNIDRIERNIESIESKITKIFKRPKNREDGSDFDDFWTKRIVSSRSIF